MKWIIFTHLFLCVAISAWSQTAASVKVSGTLTDRQTGEIISGATVNIKGTTTSVITDKNGLFELKAEKLPVVLSITHISFEKQELIVNHHQPLNLSLEPSFAVLNGAILKSKAYPTRIIDYNGSAELITQATIRQSPTTSIYDLTGYKKGFHLTSSSLTFKTPVTRGFSGSGSTRVNQLIDGMDNQAPGLNFFIGNHTGPIDLDIESIELLPGASSALYGPGGMNGTILINSKSPFQYPGLSFEAKQGVMHLGKSNRGNSSGYYDYSLRWAHVLNNRLAFKVGAQYLSATDWLASDTSNYLRAGTAGRLIPGTRQTDPNYDGVNVYGDEISVDIRAIFMQAMQDPNVVPILQPFMSNPQKVSRTGYQEIDLIDPKTRNIKLNGALHYKLNSKIEAILAGYWATGNTVYTDDNRYSLKGIKIGQYKLELKHKDWFLRTYTTQEDAGEAYSATVATQIFNESWKPSYNPSNPSGSWYPQYGTVFITAAATRFQQVFMESLGMGMSQQAALAAAQSAVVAGAPAFHQQARAFADQGRPVAGSPEFKQLYDKVRLTPIPNGGRFKEKSQLWMTEGQYRFSSFKFMDVIAGASFKKYILDSDGTLFIDAEDPINITEIGGYVQASKPLFKDRLVLTASGRFDKNKNFKIQFTPRLGALVRMAKDHNLRMSYQTAYRFPGNLSQWIMLNVGGDEILLGGLPWIIDTMQANKFPVHRRNSDGSYNPNPHVFTELKPETMSSFEVGYKGLIQNKLLIDAYAYFGKYQDFIGRISLHQPATGNNYSIVTNSNNKVKTHGFGLGFDYRMAKNYSTFFNVYSDVITNVPSGFRAFFNTPKYKINAGVANSGLGKQKRIGFNVMLRWQDEMYWEGELASGPVKSFTTMDAQMSYKIPSIKSMIKLGGTNITNNYYKNAYANPSIGGLYYISFVHNL